MTSELRITTLTKATGDGPAALSQQSAAKAMAQYLGTTNVVQSGSINHSSVTDNGTGVYGHNFSNNFATNAYLVIGANQVFVVTSTIHNYGLHDDAAQRTTSLAQMEAHYVNGSTNRTNYDFHVNDFTAFGDLA